MPGDRRRDPKKEKFWRRMVFDQARSGLSIRAWCRQHDLHEHAFYWWRVRLARSGRGRKARSRRPTPFAARPTPLCSMGKQGQAFVPVQVSAPEVTGAADSIEIVLPGDRRIRVRGRVDRQALADVLAVLEATPC